MRQRYEGSGYGTKVRATVRGFGQQYEGLGGFRQWYEGSVNGKRVQSMVRGFRQWYEGLRTYVFCGEVGMISWMLILAKDYIRT